MNEQEIIDYAHSIQDVDPLYDMYNDSLYDAMVLDGIFDKREKWTTYTFNGFGVPRVTEILRDTIGKDYLAKWGASLGADYQKESMAILDTGSLAHEMIEDYLIHGKIKSSYTSYPNAKMIQAYSCYNNFVSFWNDMKQKNIKINPIYIEQPITTPFYGGTCDCVANFEFQDGSSKNYILDFKSSNQISPDYFLQTTMYLEAFQFEKRQLNHDVPIIDGVGIIRLDKNVKKYEFLIVDDQQDQMFLYNLHCSVHSMINWYYHYQSINYQYRQFKRSALKRS